MNRFDRRLLAAACRGVTLATAVVWACAIASAWLLEIALAGPPVSLGHGDSYLLRLASLSLPIAIQIGVPLGSAMALFALADRGELVGGAATGARPARVAAWLALPGVVLAAGCVDLVNSARPAAEAAFRDAAYQGVRAFAMQHLDDLQGRRVGSTRIPETDLRQVLMSVGDYVVGVRFGAAEAAELRDGGFGVLVPGQARAWHGGFERLVLDVPGGRVRSLGDRVESELSTSKLRLASDAWSRERAPRAVDTARASAAAELRRRQVLPWGVVGGLALALMPLRAAPLPHARRWRHAASLGVAVLFAVFLPRLCG